MTPQTYTSQKPEILDLLSPTARPVKPAPKDAPSAKTPELICPVLLAA